MNVEAINTGAVSPVALTPPVAPIPAVTGVARAGETAKSATEREAEKGLFKRKPEPGERGMEEAIGVINEALRPLEIALKFRRDEESGVTVVEMIDESTSETLRQCPTEAMLHLSTTLGKLQGVICDRAI